MRIKYKCLSDTGLVRQINQDAIFCKQEKEIGLFVVADGMGGHANGELASMETVEQMIHWWDTNVVENEPSDFLALTKSLENSVRIANYQIYKKYNKEEICGCTIVALLIFQNHYAVLSAGDSRIYLYRGMSSLRQLTIDDVWETQQTVRNSYTQAEIEQHHLRGKLINAIGASEKASLRIVTDYCKLSDTFLLCSDGVYKMCSEQRLKYWMKTFRRNPDSSGCMQALKQEVYENGARDNLSAILVKIVK